MLRVLVCVGLLTGAAAGAEPISLLSAEEFEAHVSGQTVYWMRDDEDFGAEQYLPDHSVIWQPTGGPCVYGRWYAEGPLICFRYEDEPDEPICWSFAEVQGGLVARREGGDLSSLLRAGAQTPAPLKCGGALTS